MMTRSELIDSLRRIERHFDSNAYDVWFEEQNDKDKIIYLALESEIAIRRGRLENEQLQALADKLYLLAPLLEKGIEELEKEIKKMKDFTRTMETLAKVIGLVATIITTVA
uniref:Uncharacterized protein n=1 Tax=Candidatus Kentrum sp. LFY TaxID=2126342 RepID=A0A450V4E4_9GAMM|nr:MAG: hypothetical protein BECKLFY1418A_GA0070994_11032 [Candidatus Kentron sp. LFY]